MADRLVGLIWSRPNPCDVSISELLWALRRQRGGGERHAIETRGKEEWATVCRDRERYRRERHPKLDGLPRALPELGFRWDGGLAYLDHAGPPLVACIVGESAAGGQADTRSPAPRPTDPTSPRTIAKEACASRIIAR